VPAVSAATTKPGSSTRPPVVRAYGGSLTYSLRRNGSAQATVTPPRPGAYRVRTTGGDEAGSFELALGDSVGGKVVSAVVGALMIGAVFGIAGIVLLIRTCRRRAPCRRRVRRHLRFRSPHGRRWLGITGRRPARALTILGPVVSVLPVRPVR
jgi:hypothetical protein